MTRLSLSAIGKNGGPRCCKRDSYLAIIEAVGFTKEKLNVEMELDEIKCSRSKLNNQCIEERWPFRVKIDMSGQYSKLISDIPVPDIVVTMGCNVKCPNMPCKERSDWGLDDPTGKSDEEFIKTANLIKEKVLDLMRKYK